MGVAYRWGLLIGGGCLYSRCTTVDGGFTPSPLYFPPQVGPQPRRPSQKRRKSQQSLSSKQYRHLPFIEEGGRYFKSCKRDRTMPCLFFDIFPVVDSPLPCLVDVTADISLCQCHVCPVNVKRKEGFLFGPKKCENLRTAPAQSSDRACPTTRPVTSYFLWTLDVDLDWG